MRTSLLRIARRAWPLLVLSVALPVMASQKVCSKSLLAGTPLLKEAASTSRSLVSDSALFTPSEFLVIEQVARSRDGHETTLSFQEGGGTIAVFARARANRSRTLTLDWSLPPRGADEYDMRRRLAVLEHLYSFVFRQSPLAPFAFGAPKNISGSARRDVLSQPEVLARVAQLRECVIAELDAETRHRTKAWISPSIESVKARGVDALQVSGRVRSGRSEPFQGTLAFVRGEHLACGAEVRRDGTAACTLFDGHRHEHSHEASEPMVLTYSGHVAADHIVLPMTRVFTHGIKSQRQHRSTKQ